MSMEPKTELQKNAIADLCRRELESYQRALDVKWLDSRMEDGRMGRCLALIQKEAEMEKEFQERTDHAAIVNARAEKEIALGVEIARVQREKSCELLRQHYMRERDPSLRELSKKLQAGYICRDLRQQILNNEYKKLQDKIEEQRANNVLRNALYNDHEAKLNEESEKKRRTTQYCHDLQQQLVTREQQRQCQYEDTLVEKKMLDDIMRMISDEDKREIEQKREQTAKLRYEMVTSQRAREAWREKQKQAIVAEERAIEQQRSTARNLNDIVVAEREKKIHVKEERNKKITAKTLADEAERLHREDIIKQLQEQEYLEKNILDDAAQREKVERTKRETKRALTQQMEEHRKMERDDAKRAAEFRILTEAKLDADNAKEEEKQRQAREKRRRYAAELLQQIEENSIRRKKEQRLEDNRAQYVWDYDKAWRREVGEERKKIIEEHAPHLVGYLQAGVLQPEDVPALKEGAAKHSELASLDLESLTLTKRPKRHEKCNAQCRVLRQY